MTRAKTADTTPRQTTVRAGRVTPAAKRQALSAPYALLWGASIVLVLVWVLRDLVLLVGYSVLLAFALLPVVAAIERPLRTRGPRLPRRAAAAVVMLGLVTVVGWLLSLAVPRLAVQAVGFASGAPQALGRLILELRAYGAGHGMSAWLDPILEEARANLSGLLENLGATLAGWAAQGLGGIGQVLGLAVLPLLAFYLLAEPTAVQVSALRFVPKGAHSEIARIGKAVDRALRSYVRGQAIVCLVMGVAVGGALALLGSPMALLLGLLVGLAELVPYLGFLAAATAIALAGLTVGLPHALAGLAAYVVLNWAIGTFVTPLVMGRYLKMHPFLVTVSVLAGIQFFGPGGALVALPGAAVLQTLVGELTATAPRPSEKKPPSPAPTQR